MAYTFKHGDRPLDGLTVQRAIGRGGFGEVYYALTDSGKQVALKYLRDNPEVELRGIAHVMNLKSPHLITIYDVRRDAQGEPFVIMEYVSGPSLRELLNAEPGAWAPQKAAYFLTGIAKGLSYLHERGIVHRDLKPANIFYDDGYVKIGDYGLSKHIAVSRHSAQTVSVGTVHYMAPEIGSGNYTKAIDIYALGVMLFEMLTGRLPFTGSSMGEILMRHVSERPNLAGVPEPFAAVIARALAKEPTARYQSANEMIDALAHLGESAAAFDPSGLTLTPRDPDAHDPDRTLTRSPVRPVPRVVPSGLDVREVVGDAIPEIPPLPGELPGRLGRKARRLREKLSKLEQRVRGLGGAPPAPPPPLPQPSTGGTRASVWPKLATVGLAAGALAVGLGFLSEARMPEAAFAVLFYLLGAVAGPLMAHFWVLSRSELRHPLLDRIVYAGAGALAMMPAVAIASEAGRGGRHLALLIIPLVAMLAVFNWHQRIEAGRRQRFNGWDAFWPAIFGLIVAKIVNADNVALTGGGLCGGVALLMQAAAAIWAVRRQAVFDPAVPPRMAVDQSGGVVTLRGKHFTLRAGVVDDSPPPSTPVPAAPPLPTPVPSSACGIELAQQPSFVGRTANAGLSLVGKVMLLSGLVFGVTYPTDPIDIRLDGERFWMDRGTIYHNDPSGASESLFHVPAGAAVALVLGGTILLVVARRGSGRPHVLRAVLGGALALLLAALVVAPGSQFNRAIEALFNAGDPRTMWRYTPHYSMAIGLAVVSLLLLFWPRQRGPRTIVV